MDLELKTSHVYLSPKLWSKSTWKVNLGASKENQGDGNSMGLTMANCLTNLVAFHGIVKKQRGLLHDFRKAFDIKSG